MPATESRSADMLAGSVAAIRPRLAGHLTFEPEPGAPTYVRVQLDGRYLYTLDHNVCARLIESLPADTGPEQFYVAIQIFVAGAKAASGVRHFGWH